jgi:uncharacterized membrane protein|tara:strand:- start:442 stop:642 length:201 start_codon:yes stop_codon:yes gene_type:complete
MEPVWNTLNDLVIFLIMILLGGITWFLSNLILSKFIINQRIYEVISIVLGLSVGVLIIMNSWNLSY